MAAPPSLYSNPLLSRYTLVTPSTVKCGICPVDSTKTYKYDPKSSGNVLRHIRDRHPEFVLASTDIQAKFDELVGRLVLRRRLPFSIVEDKEFVQIVELLNPSVNPPSRRNLADVIVPGLASAAVEEALKVISGCPISITTDGWRSTVHGVYLISVTAHVITDSWVLREVVLAARSLTGGKSAAVVSMELQKIFVKKDIQPWMGVTDNAPAEVAAVRHAGLENIVCPAHLVNNAVRSAIKLSADVSAIIARGRAVAGCLHRSIPIRQALNNALISRGRKPRNIPQDVVTRWGSAYFMLDIVEQEVDSLNDVVHLIGVPLFTPSDRELMAAVKRILFLPSTFTMAVSRRACTASETLPLFTLAFAQLQTLMAEERGAARSFATLLHDELEKRYIRDISHKSFLYMSLLLDARYAMDDALLPADKWDEMKADFIRSFDTGAQVVGTPPPPVAVLPAIPSPPTTTSFTSLYDVLRKKRNVPPSIAPSPPVSLSMTEELKEFGKALQMSRPDTEAPVTAWWQENAARFPLLAPLAKRLLAVPASSISSERVFSTATAIARDPSRNRLAAQKLEQSILYVVNQHPEPRAMKAERIRPIRLQPLPSGHVRTPADDEEICEDDDEGDDFKFVYDDPNIEQEYDEDEEEDEEREREKEAEEEIVEGKSQKRKGDPLCTTPIKKKTN